MICQNSNETELRERNANFKWHLSISCSSGNDAIGSTLHKVASILYDGGLNILCRQPLCILYFLQEGRGGRGGGGGGGGGGGATAWTLVSGTHSLNKQPPLSPHPLLTPHQRQFYRKYIFGKLEHIFGVKSRKPEAFYILRKMRKSVVRRNWEDLLCGKYEQKLLSGKNMKIWFSFTHTAVPAGAVGQFLNQKVAKKKMHTNGVQQYRGWTNKQTSPYLQCRGAPHNKRLL